MPVAGAAPANQIDCPGTGQGMQPCGKRLSDACCMCRELEEAILRDILGILAVPRDAQANVVDQAGRSDAQARRRHQCCARGRNARSRSVSAIVAWSIMGVSTLISHGRLQLCAQGAKRGAEMRLIVPDIAQP